MASPALLPSNAPASAVFQQRRRFSWRLPKPSSIWPGPFRKRPELLAFSSLDRRAASALFGLLFKIVGAH